MSNRSSTPPAMLLVIAGTATEVGKTFVGAALVDRLRAGGRVVAARKPAQSFEAGTPVAATDAGVLGAASGEDPEVVCPADRWYPVALAPPMAAEVLGLPPVELAELVADTENGWPVRRADVGVVELAGGVCSPLAAAPVGIGADDGVAFIRELEPDLVVLVADAGLGTIDSVRRATAMLAPFPVVVMCNRFDPDDELHRRNVAWLADRDGLEVVASVDALVEAVTARCPAFCGWCGSAECAGVHTGPPGGAELEPERFCRTCGRRQAVVITPLRHRARCPIHGEPRTNG